MFSFPVWMRVGTILEDVEILGKTELDLGDKVYIVYEGFHHQILSILQHPNSLHPSIDTHAIKASLP